MHIISRKPRASYYDKQGVIVHYWKGMHMSDTLQSCFSLASAHQVSEPSLAARPQKQVWLLWLCDESLDSSMRVYRQMRLCARSHVSNGQKLDECNCATANSFSTVHFHEQKLARSWFLQWHVSLFVHCFIKISPRLLQPWRAVFSTAHSYKNMHLHFPIQWFNIILPLQV